MVFATPTTEVPAPALMAGVCAVNVVFGPYSTNHIVASPCGLTLPATTAECGDTLFTAPVTTAGGAVAAATEGIAIPALAASAANATAVDLAKNAFRKRACCPVSVVRGMENVPLFPTHRRR